MNEISTGGMMADIVGGITFGGILTYFGLTAEGLMILTVFLGLDIVFGVLDSYIVTKDTSSKKLVQGLAKKLTRWLLPFLVVATLKGIGYQEIELLSNIIMSTLIISEGYSILGHFFSINYGETLPEIDCLKVLFEKIADLFKKESKKTKNVKKLKN